jgi:hypothetical protein
MPCLVIVQFPQNDFPFQSVMKDQENLEQIFKGKGDLETFASSRMSELIGQPDSQFPTEESFKHVHIDRDLAGVVVVIDATSECMKVYYKYIRRFVAALNGIEFSVDDDGEVKSTNIKSLTKNQIKANAKWAVLHFGQIFRGNNFYPVALEEDKPILNDVIPEEDEQKRRAPSGYLLNSDKNLYGLRSLEGGIGGLARR